MSEIIENITGIIDKPENLGVYEHNKLEFLEKCYSNETTRYTYYRLFRRCIEFEIKYNCDIFQFNIDQMEKTLEELSTMSYNTYLSVTNVVSKYYKYMLTHHKKIKHYFQMEELKELIEQYTIKEKIYCKDLISYKDIVEMISSKNLNKQDLACVVLPFLSIHGTNSDELLNLKWSDIDLDKKLIEVKDKNGKMYKMIVLNEAIVRFLKALRKEKVYKSYKSEVTFRLEEDDYVIKAAHAGKAYEDTNVGRIFPGVVRDRVKRILKQFRYRHNTNLNFILKCGQYHMLKEIQDHKRVLTSDDFMLVCTMFGNNKNTWYGLKQFYESVIINPDDLNSKKVKRSKPNDFVRYTMQEDELGNNTQIIKENNIKNNTKVKEYDDVSIKDLFKVMSELNENVKEILKYIKK